MNVGIIAHNSKKALIEDFCIAYKNILAKHEIYATGTTGRRIEEVTNLRVHKFLPGSMGGDKQFTEMIERGDIGKVITFKTTFGHGGPETWSIDPGSNTWFFDKKKAAMGAMADLGIHKTDLIQYLMGEYVAETTAVITTLDKKDGSGNLIGVDDNAICIYKMESGAV